MLPITSSCSFGDGSRQAPSAASLSNTRASSALSPCTANVLLRYKAFIVEIYKLSEVATRIFMSSAPPTRSSAQIKAERISLDIPQPILPPLLLDVYLQRVLLA